MVTKVDISNRALQHVGALRINGFTDGSRNALEVNFMWPFIRQACLRDSVWRFALRRIAMRNITSTTQAVTFPTWASGTTYAQAFVVTGSDGNLYRSLVGSNTGNDPTLDNTAANWVLYYGPVTADTYGAGTKYYAGELVIYSGNVYISTTNAQSGNTPTSGLPWVVLTSATSAAYLLTEAIGYGPNVTTAKNYFRLPYGFMRLGPQDMKQPANTVLGSSAGLRYSDWEWGGQYLLSASAAPLFVNCVVDIGFPGDWDPAFREFTSARMALELVEILTQDPTKMQLIGTIYQRYRNAARTLNAIELGTTEPVDEAYEPEYQLLGDRPSSTLMPAPGGSNSREGR